MTLGYAIYDGLRGKGLYYERKRVLKKKYNVVRDFDTRCLRSRSNVFNGYMGKKRTVAGFGVCTYNDFGRDYNNFFGH